MVSATFTKLTPFRSYPRSMRCLVPILTCLVLASLAAPAAAQCRLCYAGEAALATADPAAVPVQLEVETSLDFDQVVLTGTAGGIARLGPDGSRGTSGALEAISARAMVGEILIRGEPGRSIRIDLPGRIDLYGSGGSLSITRISSDLSPAPRLDGAGRLRVRFGGELFVAGNAEGTYRGDVAITVDYL